MQVLPIPNLLQDEEHHRVVVDVSIPILKVFSKIYVYVCYNRVIYV